MKPKFFALFIALGLSLQLHAQSVALEASTYEVVNVSFIDIRNKPDKSARLLGRLRAGESVTGVQTTDGWLHIEYKGQDAYVQSVNLRQISNALVYDEVAVAENIDQSPEEDVNEPLDTTNGSSSVTFHKKVQDFISKMPDYLLAVPQLKTDKLDLYLSGRLGLGISSYSWREGPVYGKCYFAIDAVTQLYLKDKVAFLPRGYYAEMSLGYASKGASSFPMHYLDLNIIPVGYSYEFNKFCATGKFGFYTGFPLSKLRYMNDSKVDFGVSLGAAVDYQLVSAGLTFNHGFINIATPDVKLRNWCLMLQLTCKILSFK